MIASTVQLIMAFNSKKSGYGGEIKMNLNSALQIAYYFVTIICVYPCLHFAFPTITCLGITVFKNSCTLAPIPASAAAVEKSQ